ncbi:hypothetical protein [Cupriavidus sp. CP313]
MEVVHRGQVSQRRIYLRLVGRRAVAYACNVAPHRFQPVADLLGQRAKVGLLRRVGIAALRNDAGATAASQRALLGQPGHWAYQQADQVVRGGFAVQRQFGAVGHVADVKLRLPDQRAVPLEQRPGWGVQAQLADLLPGRLQLARSGIEVEGGVFHGGLDQLRQVGGSLVVRAIEGRAEPRIARQHRIDGAATHLGLAHEVERVPDDGKAAHFTIGDTDRMRGSAQHDIHRAT